MLLLKFFDVNSFQLSEAWNIKYFVNIEQYNYKQCRREFIVPPRFNLQNYFACYNEIMFKNIIQDMAFYKGLQEIEYYMNSRRIIINFVQNTQ